MPSNNWKARMHAITTLDLLRATWPRHTAKQAARAANSPVATAKAWVQARFTPSADTLLRMAAENAELRAELIRRLGEFDHATSLSTPVDGAAIAERRPDAGETSRQDRSSADVALPPARGRKAA
jgi:hypothetical protein